MPITYNYKDGSLSHFALKKMEGNCDVNPSRSTLVGVFCHSCPHFLGSRGKFVVCAHHQKDDEGASETRNALYDEIRQRALSAL